MSRLAVSRGVSTIAVDLALEEDAADLGVELSPTVFSSEESRKEASEAVTELRASRESTSTFCEELKAVDETLFAAMQKVAKASKSPKLEKFLDEYREQIEKNLHKTSEAGMEAVLDSKLFGPNFRKMSGSVKEILEVGIQFAGNPDDEEDPKKKRMKKLMLLATALVAAAFLAHFGISPEMIAMAAIFMQALNEDKKKSNPSLEAKKLAEKIVKSPEVKKVLQDELLEEIQKIHPKIEDLKAMKSLISARNKNDESLALFTKAKAMADSAPMPKESSQEKIDNLSASLSEVMKRELNGLEDEEKKEKLKRAFYDSLSKDREKIRETLKAFNEEEFKKKSLSEKAEAFLSALSASYEFIDGFKAIMEKEGYVDRYMAEKIAKEMKKYVYQKFGKPVEEVIISAEKPKAKSVAEKLGLTQNKLSELKGKIARSASLSITK